MMKILILLIFPIIVFANLSDLVIKPKLILNDIILTPKWKIEKVIIDDDVYVKVKLPPNYSFEKQNIDEDGAYLLKIISSVSRYKLFIGGIKDSKTEGLLVIEPKVTKDIYTIDQRCIDLDITPTFHNRVAAIYRVECSVEDDFNEVIYTDLLTKERSKIYENKVVVAQNNTSYKNNQKRISKTSNAHIISSASNSNSILLAVGEYRENSSNDNYYLGEFSHQIEALKIFDELKVHYEKSKKRNDNFFLRSEKKLKNYNLTVGAQYSHYGIFNDDGGVSLVGAKEFTYLNEKFELTFEKRMGEYLNSADINYKKSLLNLNYRHLKIGHKTINSFAVGFIYEF